MIVPETTGASLWKKLWLNVLNHEEIAMAEPMESSAMPWLGATRLSEKKGAIREAANATFAVNRPHQYIKATEQKNTESTMRAPGFTL